MSNPGPWPVDDFYSFGARIDQPDMFFEIDYMNSTDPGITPRVEALQLVVDSFARRGYRSSLVRLRFFDRNIQIHSGSDILSMINNSVSTWYRSELKTRL